MTSKTVKILAIVCLVFLVISFIGWTLFLGGGFGTGILNYSGIMIGYAVIVAVQIVLMGVLLGLVVFCKRKEGQEENTGLIIVIVLMWVAVGILQVALDGIALYLSFGVWFVLLVFAIFSISFNAALVSLFCAGIGISGIATIPSCILLLVATIVRFTQSSRSTPRPGEPAVMHTTAGANMTVVTIQPTAGPIPAGNPPGYTPYAMEQPVAGQPSYDPNLGYPIAMTAKPVAADTKYPDMKPTN